MKKSKALLDKEKEYESINAKLEEKTNKLMREANDLLDFANLQERKSKKNSDDPLQTRDHKQTEEADNDEQDDAIGECLTASKSTELAHSKSNAAAAAAIQSDLHQRIMAIAQDDDAARNRNRANHTPAGKFTHATEQLNAFLDSPTRCRRDDDDDDADDAIDVNTTADDAALEDEILSGKRGASSSRNITDVAQIRMLKAKLHIMSEENEKLNAELASKTEKQNALANQLRQTEDERNRLQRTNAAQLSQLQKSGKLAEEATRRAETAETARQELSRRLDQLEHARADQQQADKSVKVRLNRALDQLDKEKQLRQEAGQSAAEAARASRMHIDQLEQQCRRLEKQRAELVQGWKRQMELIDVLKRQRMHLEAAKLLEFTEQEFSRAIESAGTSS